MTTPETTPDRNRPPSKSAVADREQGTDFQPKFDGNGLIPAIVTELGTGQVLMFAHMNEEALALTIANKVAHFWSRSRAKIWKKGEDSGNELKVHEMRTDCDQDVIWLTASVAGNGVACHTGAKSCFYRRIVAEQGSSSDVKLHFVAAPNSSSGT